VRITVFPIKSLDGHDLTATTLLESGALAWDRRFRLIDQQGRSISVRNERRLTLVRCQFDASLTSVVLSTPSHPPEQFELMAGESPLTNWFSEFLARKVALEANREVGFPDDLEAAGPTLLSQGTLRWLHDTFSQADADEHYRRLRANLLVDAEQAFWEDRLVGDDAPLPFRIGDVAMRGEKLCQRCVVPSLDSRTGRPTAQFAKTVAARREANLPSWSPRRRFDHFYRISVNTSLDLARGHHRRITLGDPVVAADN
jgi:uncharacterized protein YcbX